ncbi:MAG: site-2 protease family protein [Deltaproteobacteria bacterium]|nr:site-2 protease family protein [Deltaproteobacteria bacterium]
MHRQRGWKLATIRGIDLRLDVSLIFLLIYVVFVASARFPVIAESAGIDPVLLRWGPVSWGILFAIGLFTSVVLHELGHSFVAQAANIKVKSITLMMLGGVSSIERLPEDRPYFEFKLAIAGPLVSFGIAALLYAVRMKAPYSPSIFFFSYWLGNANLALGIFNLLPAFPLDGGRALRSLLTARKGVIRGTQISVSVSKVLAIILGALGFFQFNLLLMLIAFFVYVTAQSELNLLLTRGLLRGISAGQVVDRIAPIDENLSLDSVVTQMTTTRNTVLPVATASGEPALIGLAQVTAVPRALWSTKRVHDVMLEAPKVLDAKDPIAQILPEILATPVGALPVREDGRVIGVVKYTSLAELLQLKNLEAA